MRVITPPEIGRFRWQPPRRGLVAARRATRDDVVALDRAWLPGRRPSDSHDWQWVRAHECGADVHVIEERGVGPISAWGSYDEKLKKLQVGSCYRLDFFESAPSCRGDGITGALAFAIVAAHAKLLKGTHIVLGAVPGSESFYRQMGGVEGPVHGWKTARGLLAFHFDSGALDRLVERLDGIREEVEEA